MTTNFFIIALLIITVVIAIIILAIVVIVLRNSVYPKQSRSNKITVNQVGVSPPHVVDIIASPVSISPNATMDQTNTTTSDTIVSSAPISPTAPIDIRTKKLLSNAEIAFFKILAKANQGRYVIALKIPLDEIFQRREMLDKDLYSMYANGHVDFLLVHPLSWQPVGAVELDDSTHRTPGGRERDSRKDFLFQQAKLPLTRFRVGEDWQAENIQQWIASLGSDKFIEARKSKE
jgi:hypothetical protein